MEVSVGSTFGREGGAFDSLPGLCLAAFAAPPAPPDNMRRHAASGRGAAPRARTNRGTPPAASGGPPPPASVAQCSTPGRAELLPHGLSDKKRNLRDTDRRTEEELAAEWRASIADAGTLAAKLLAEPAGGGESVAVWLTRRFQEQGIKCARRLVPQGRRRCAATQAVCRRAEPPPADPGPVAAAPRRLPCITVAYQGLSVETDAAVGAGGIPSVSRWLGLDALLACGRGAGPRGTVRLPILRGVRGVLRPGRLTLLLGPPGSGKSVLLQTLAGQLRSSKRTRIQGSVTYNGEPAAAFDLQRTASYVDQYDVFLPLLTVRETLAFANHALWLSGCKNDLGAEFAQVGRGRAAARPRH